MKYPAGHSEGTKCSINGMIAHTCFWFVVSGLCALHLTSCPFASQW
jgi:hypothetical protein